MKILLVLILASTLLYAAETKKICKIVNVRPMTKEELEKAGIPQINYGTQYVQRLVCEVVEK
jgi:hypothetical protein